MPVTFIVEREYEMDADAHFAAVMMYNELAEVMEGQVRYDGMPEGALEAGQSIDLKLTLFGWLPYGHWHIDVLERDNAARRMVSSEKGGIVRLHHHVISVEPREGGGCIHRDELTVDAGLLTGFYAHTARRMYEKRHDMRAQLRAGR